MLRLSEIVASVAKGLCISVFLAALLFTDGCYGTNGDPINIGYLNAHGRASEKSECTRHETTVGCWDCHLPPYYQRVGPLRVDHAWMTGKDNLCERHAGKRWGCGMCHVIE
jgi:hypothetical protein